MFSSHSGSSISGGELRAELNLHVLDISEILGEQVEQHAHGYLLVTVKVVFQNTRDHRHPRGGAVHGQSSGFGTAVDHAPAGRVTDDAGVLVILREVTVASLGRARVYGPDSSGRELGWLAGDWRFNGAGHLAFEALEFHAERT